MTENDKRILARACGLLCWHESDNPNVVGSFKEGGGLIYQTCKHCGKLISTSYQTLLLNPTFTTPDDWEMVRVKVCNDPAFVPYVWNHMQDQYGTIHDAFAYWMTLSPEQCCQAVCNWIKSRPDLFPWVWEEAK